MGPSPESLQSCLGNRNYDKVATEFPTRAAALIEEHTGKSEETMTLVGGRSSTQMFVVGVILASVYGVSSLLPISGFIVATGITASISFTICVAPLFGILLGPTRGCVFGLIGGAVGGYLAVFVGGVPLIVPTVVFGPAISGLFTGLCLKRMTTAHGSRIPGPLLTFMYLIIVIILYLIPNHSAWWFVTPYILAALLSLGLQLREVKIDSTAKGLKMYVRLLPFTLIGTITDFSMMTMGAVYLLGLPAALFGYVIFPAMLVERTTATIVSAILAAAVLTTFRGLWQ